MLIFRSFPTQGQSAQGPFVYEQRSPVVSIRAHRAKLPTALYYLNDDGSIARFVLQFRQGVTGPITFPLLGADDLPEDLTGASSVTLTVTKANGVVVINARALTVVGAPTLGRVMWNRTSNDVAAAGAFALEVRVVRADGTIGKFPDPASGGLVITPSPTL